ncbi:ArsD-related vicinal cysteine protein VcpD [Paenibacillus tarimensis]|uniref:ArsD-related vicinal cysteine protein VcpD n=1 Tax=Paenibacillus tarimensis TaxID=416012 RepID=UPI001F2E6D10|nr:hypothetical protein [Paenibacillus tarimensis]MCF2945281.1 hypothetical protein [Paenibacillus tarimensis]
MKKHSIELYPAIMTAEPDGGCCVDEAASDCCDPSASAFPAAAPFHELKQRLKERYEQEVYVHVYDYALAMDRALAKRKLKALFKERGFSHLSVDDMLKLATPAAVVDGRLVSFASDITYEQLEHALLLQKLEENAV